MNDIIFERISYKNFLSAGEQPITVELAVDDRTIVVGENGSGKSSLIDAITFACFGKPFRNIKQAMLINSINRSGAEVVLQYTRGDHTYQVHRGLKPNFLKVIKNGQEVPALSSLPETQRDFEENHLGMNRHTFSQIVCIGNATSVPFMKLTPAERRKLVEDLLDLNVITAMKDKLKIKNKSLASMMHNKEISRSSIQSKVDTLKEQESEEQERRAKLTENNKSRLEEKEKELKEKEAKHKEERSQWVSRRSTNYERINETEALKSRWFNLKTTLAAEIKPLFQQLEFFKKHTECPTCTSPLKEDFLQEKIEDIKNALNEKKKVLDEATEKHQYVSEQCQTLETERKTIESEFSKLNSLVDEIRNLKKEIVDLKEITDPDEVSSSINEKIEESQKALDDIQKDIDKLSSIDEIMGHCLVALKDNGIRAKVLERYLPMLNERVNHYLEILDFFASFNIDENFQENIKARHVDTYTFDSFSEGEKQRINLAMLFAWRDMARAKSSLTTNLLVLDETFDSSIDSEGITGVTDILASMEDQNVIVISHRDIDDTMFDRTLRFKRDGNFSSVSQD